MKKQEKKKLPEFLWQIAAIVLACISAVCFRPSMGIVRMLPIPLVCMLLCAFLPTKRWQRFAYFLLLSLALNAVELDDNILLAVAAVSLLVSFVIAECAAWLIKKKSKALLALAVVLCVLCPVVNSLLVGNPISAWKADKQIRRYTERVYDITDGGFTFSKLSYDFYRRSYGIVLSSDSHPTEPGTISCRKGFLTDGYLSVLETLYQQKNAETVSAAIRSVSEDDRFYILSTGIVGFPRAGALLKEENDGTYDAGMTYCIRLSGKTNFEKLEASTLAYASAFGQQNIPFGRIVFSGYNALGARSVFALEASDYDGILYHSVKPVFVTRRYGGRYAIETNELLTFFSK